ncbi:hypothetical protein L2E82_14192 [Cichorium intybus]|uniref:Uncharacterized protein n=1 Tax=Cichorium intybus TaxID=13427 RepID=A0ACB9EZ18_CICIN|nr:hypothetical protein L2E82_14192 [Cichorium intybus]
MKRISISAVLSAGYLLVSSKDHSGRLRSKIHISSGSHLKGLIGSFLSFIPYSFNNSCCPVQNNVMLVRLRLRLLF